MLKAKEAADLAALGKLNLWLESVGRPVLPTLQDAGRRTTSGRWKMILVLLVCALPVIASYFTYYVIRPQGRSNYGELIDPQRPLPSAGALATVDGKAPDALEQLQKKAGGPIRAVREDW